MGRELEFSLDESGVYTENDEHRVHKAEFN